MFFCDFLKYNGLPVYAMRERVNRYEIRFGNMLTLPVTYGKMFLDRKGCGRRWIEALKERGVWMAAVGGVWPTAEVKDEARLGEGK